MQKREGSEMKWNGIGAIGLGLALLGASCTKQIAETDNAPAAKQPADAPVVETAAPTSASSADVALAAVDTFIAAQTIDKNASDWKLNLPMPTVVSFAPGKSYFWNLETNVGSMKIRLMPDVAPMHVTSTIYLTRLGFYDDIVFHRVIQGFMAQGGDPLGAGRGGPGYKYDGEFSPDVKHDRPGLLSMANAGPGTDGSQFFLTFVPTPHLNGKHTIFGEVVEGMETVRALEERGGGGSGQTTERLFIAKATISVE